MGPDLRLLAFSFSFSFWLPVLEIFAFWLFVLGVISV